MKWGLICLVCLFAPLTESQEAKDNFMDYLTLKPSAELGSVLNSSLVSQIFYTEVATTLVLATALRVSVVDKVQNDFQYHHHLGGGSSFGDLMGQLVPNVVYFSTQAAAEKWWGNPYGFKRAALMFKATLYSGLTTLLLKNLVYERRPNGADNLSFPSGHTTTAFAFASVVAAEHEWYWGVASYSLATYVGLSRINDNAHYLHDVVAGAAIGTVFGLGLSHLYSEKQMVEKSSNRIYITPTKLGASISIQSDF